MFNNDLFKTIMQYAVQAPQRYLVVGLNEQNNHMLHYLLSIGVAPGRSITLIQYSPLGDPVIIEVDGARWAMRKALWQQLELVEQTSLPEGVAS